MQDKFICPLTGKEITYEDCFDISMVVEDLAPEYTIDERIKPQNIDECKGRCMTCKKHPR
jgi:hypothetical protein